ncbi:MAG: PIG-L family deacetylase, partial [Pyrinomonadaceae bacterium]|nr:PIG-L family deacetylase [Pyrinomonadaceae bacterium]
MTMMLRNNFKTGHTGAEAKGRRWRRARKTFLFLLCVSVSLWPAAGFPDFTLSLRAQAAPVQHSADRTELHQALLDLTNLWTVMCVAAHPDDEDGATLTLLRRKHGAHTVTLFSTYGEGGQNAIGPELYEELGVIRARETLKAADIQGSQAHFLALRDFGFSKSAEETFRIWDREEALSRMVLKIRKLRPDVIITNHDITSGHGHHQATGRLVEEAFDAAADASRFPEQLIGLSVWQPQRLFVRVNYESGTGSKKLEDTAARTGEIVSIDPNERDAVRGSTYAEQALQALQQHASQGPWPQTIPKEGAPIIRYRLARQSKGVAALPSNTRTFFDRLRLNENYAMPPNPLTIDGRPLTDFVSERVRVLEALIAARKSKLFSVPSTEKDNWRYSRLNPRLTEALVKASGVKASLTSQSSVLVPGTKTTFSLTVSNQGDKEVHIRGAMFTGAGTGMDGLRKINLRGNLSPQKSMSAEIELEIPATARMTVPHAAHLYDDTLFGEAYSVGIMFDIVGERVILPLSAFTRVDVAPAVEIASIIPSPYIFTPANLNQPLSFKVRLVNHQDKPFKGEFGIA